MLDYQKSKELKFTQLLFNPRSRRRSNRSSDRSVGSGGRHRTNVNAIGFSGHKVFKTRDKKQDQIREHKALQVRVKVALVPRSGIGKRELRSRCEANPKDLSSHHVAGCAGLPRIEKVTEMSLICPHESREDLKRGCLNILR